MTAISTLWGRDWLDRLLKHESHPPGSQRQQVLAQLTELGMPTQQEEAWKYTDLSDLVNQPFELADPVALDSSELFSFPEAGIRITLVNGRLDPDLSDLSALPAGILIETVTETQLCLSQPEVWSLLNRACCPEILRIHVAKDQILEPPIYILSLTYSGVGWIVNSPHIQIIAETGSQMTLIEDHHNLKTPTNLTNTLTEIALGSNARLTHILLQGGSEQAYFINQTAIHQDRDSCYGNHTIQGGAALTRHGVYVTQTGSQAESILNQLNLLKGREQADIYSVIDHQAPYGSSQQRHKCVADQQSRGTFNGTLRVRQAAQKTDASQSSRNLLLSDKARIYTRPQLEIVADDVKCAHGATISQIENDELFYLRSRGVAPVPARQLLTYGFVAELIDRIPLPTIRAMVKERYGLD